MNLSNPLETLLRPAEANVILVLHRIGGPMTGRRIASVTGSTSASLTLKSIRRLVSAGILRARPEPNAIHYSINRDHLFWPALEAMIESRTELATRIRALADAASPRSVVLIYGSTAVHRSTADSDIDLLVVHPNDTSVAERDAFTELLARSITAWTGNRVEVYDLTRDQLRAMAAEGDPMIESWRRTHEVIAGDLPDVIASRSA